MINMKWTQRPINAETEKAFIAQGKNKLLARLLAQRDIPPNRSEEFLKSQYDQLPMPPHALKGVKEAADLFYSIAQRKGTVFCAADYDCDGVISATMIKELCNVFGLKCQVFLPSRTEHGYGLTEKSLKSIREMIKTPVDLMFITDCGSNNENEVVEIKKSLAKHVIILDHHLVDPLKMSKSADVLINWHLQDDFLETCACGEVFHLIRAIRWLSKKVDPIKFLSYAALGVLADVSPIIGNNRIIVKNGMTENSFNNILASGLNALLINSNLYPDNVTQTDILFKIAPKINAAGRIATPDLAYNLLIETNPDIAGKMANNLKELNDERKKIQKAIESEAIKMVESDREKYKYGIIVYKPEWKGGIIGIVASKLVEKFSLPAIILCKHGEMIKGSGRSLENINVKEILDGCSEMLLGHGGHSLACGATLKPEYLDKANGIFNKACKAYYEKNGYPKSVDYYDISLSPKLITLESASMIKDTMYPYCSQYNPEPIFVLKDAVIENPEVVTRGAWTILSFSASKNGEKTSLRFKTFDDTKGIEISGCKANIYFNFPQELEKNRFNQDPTLNVVELEILK